MSDANKALTRQFIQRISAGDLSAVDDLVADDYVEHEQNTIDVSLCEYFRVDNGALTEHWGVTDAARTMHQLTAPN